MAVMNPYNYKKPVGVPIPNRLDNRESLQDVSSLSRNKSDAYLEQKIMNARPEELTLMLYDGLIKFIKQVEIYNEQKSFDKSNNSNLRAQAILMELRSTLNLEIEISNSLENLYLYLMDRLIDINISKKNEGIAEILELATDLRDTWKEAMNL